MSKDGHILKHEGLFLKERNLQEHKNVKRVGNSWNTRDYPRKEEKSNRDY